MKEIQLRSWAPHVGLLPSLARLTKSELQVYLHPAVNFVDSESDKTSHSVFIDMRTGATYTSAKGDWVCIG